MRLREIYAEQPSCDISDVISFELFPPKTPQGLSNLLAHVEELVVCRPSLITCTFGAGGGARDNTLNVLDKVLAQHPDIPVASHLTCVGSTADELRRYIEDAIGRGVKTIVALRGDPPEAVENFFPVSGGLRYANELVSLINREFPDLDVIVGGYPETHSEAISPESDIQYLKLKVEAGADIIVTQLFYDNDVFYRFRDRCDAAGISAPVVPGILPITNYKQVKRIISMCGVALPAAVIEQLEARQGDDELQFNVGVDHATNQVQDLLAHGVPGVHFYVLNKSHAAGTICKRIFT